ncbi:MAG: hypothetical protein ACRDIA_08580 [Actinomycetota bacterium]
MVIVNLRDFSFDYNPKVPPGRVVFRFFNVGRATHVPSLIPLDEDFPPIDQQLRGAERRVASPFGGLRNRFPGQSGTFAVDLEAGHRYALICFAVDPDKTLHRLKGMTSEFRAGGGKPGPRPSAPAGIPQQTPNG